ncbi:two-component system response regulator [Trichloromonas sp.]|uniref:two-component system response regulator n=1 Tax=Trichloromonas sp. TaxID=3069249 RepID=UPI003D8125E5
MESEVHILLVNNDSDARQTLRNTLVQAGYERITEADNGRAAVSVLRNEPIDLLVTDVDIAPLDGWRLGRMVRSGIFRCRSSIPLIIVATTWCERIAETTAREFGINAVIPFEKHDQLPVAVAECMAAPLKVAQKPRLLVVEDCEDTAQLAERILRPRFEVEIAADGQAGLDAWMCRRHDLVLLDVMLPQLSGKQVLQRILRENPSQPVVIMTAHSTMDLAEEMMLDGAADFIAKPFMADPLRRVTEIAARREDYMVSNSQFAARVKSLRESREAYREVSLAHQHLLDSLSTVVLELDSDGRLRFLNRAWEKLTGYSGDQSLGRKLSDFRDEGHDADWQIYQNRLRALLSGALKDCALELPLKNCQGEPIWVECRLDSMSNASGSRSVSGCLDNVTKRKKAMAELEHLAMHDTLTGLFNRHYFTHTLKQMAALSARGRGNHALLYIDLDHFKVVNDSFGHYHGDVVLKQIAELMLKRLRRSDVLCRLGGDEYAALLANTDLVQALEIAGEFRETIQGLQCRVEGQVAEVSCSIGISEINGQAARTEDYLKQADIALYVAKGRGRNRVHVYDPEDRESEELRRNLDWVRRVRKAISSDCLKFHFQPVLHIASGEISHYEALVRLDLPDHGEVLPKTFIPALEKSGEMHMIDHWVIRNAISLLGQYPGLKRLAINLSAHAFGDEGIMPLVEDLLRKENVDPGRIIFELTESASLTNVSATQKMIARLQEIGCRFAVDDFGTGFSTFSYLKQFPANSIKVDGSFIRDLGNDPVNLALVRSIHEVARTLGKETVAEFVENETDLHVLREMGIDFAQGYHIGRPGPIDSWDFSLTEDSRQPVVSGRCSDLC